jgi:Arc/MetJ-type ribon-helix-helix transcriptional regulator
MQVTLSAQQSKILEALCQRGGYQSLDDAIDTALVLLADEITQQDSDETPEYLAWVEQTRRKIDAGIQAADQGELLDAENVITQLRRKVKAAKAAAQ